VWYPSAVHMDMGQRSAVAVDAMDVDASVTDNVYHVLVVHNAVVPSTRAGEQPDVRRGDLGCDPVGEDPAGEARVGLLVGRAWLEGHQISCVNIRIAFRPKLNVL